MKVEEHQESFKEHKETIFRWAIEVIGIENSQRTIGLHASRAILDLLSIYLLKKGKITAGKQVNHRWFKSLKVHDKLPDFPYKNDVIRKIVELELFKELENKIKSLENGKE